MRNFTEKWVTKLNTRLREMPSKYMQDRAIRSFEFQEKIWTLCRDEQNNVCVSVHCQSWRREVKRRIKGCVFGCEGEWCSSQP